MWRAAGRFWRNAINVSRAIWGSIAFVLVLLTSVLPLEEIIHSQRWMVIVKIAAWVVLAFVWFIYVPGTTMLETEKRLATLESARTPKLTLEFDRDDPSCVMLVRNVEPYATLYRVRVTNTTDATVSGVRVELTEVEPAFISYLPAPLQIMHENDNVREITLNPHQPRYVDVVQRADVGGPVVLWHTVAGQDRRFTPLGNFALTITVWAHNTAPSSDKFCVLLDRRGSPIDFDRYRSQPIHWTF